MRRGCNCISLKSNFLPMKTILFSSLLLAAFLMVIAFNKPPAKNSSNNKAVTANSSMVVLELFTSEGCSSCPAADKIAARLSEEYKGKLLVLGFHVDYWNSLGWKDIYSSSACTQRQQWYAQQFRSASVYTPQAVINGKDELVGSDENRLRSLINKYLRSTPTTSLQINTQTEGNTIGVNYIAINPGEAIVHFALVQLHAVTEVRNGENSGSRLQHINVVRDFVSEAVQSSNKGTATLTVPEGLTAKDYSIVAYLQQKNGNIIAAVKTE